MGRLRPVHEAAFVVIPSSHVVSRVVNQQDVRFVIPRLRHQLTHAPSTLLKRLVVVVGLHSSITSTLLTNSKAASATFFYKSLITLLHKKMVSKLFVIASLALSSYTVLAGDTVVNVEHGDGHVDNTIRSGGGGIAEYARLHNSKVHTGHGISNQDLDTDFGDWHHEDAAIGEHENLLHEDLPELGGGYHSADFGAGGH
jgi:hypothetical protein